MIRSKIDELLILLKEKATLITPNKRLAQYFQVLYQQFQLSHNCMTFETPQIFSYDTWLKNQWQTHGRLHFPDLTLITPQQSHVIWEEVISANNPFFFNVNGVIREAKKAFKLCYAWNISIKKESFVEQGNIDTAMFYEWVLAYRKKLKENHWIDLDRLSMILQKKSLNNQDNHINTNILITGFDNLPTGIAALFNHMSDSNVAVYENLAQAKKITKIDFLSAEDELNTFIDWAKNTLINHKPNYKIACIIPDITEKRKKLDRILRRTFEEKEYTISAGYIFSECTMISQALKMLSLNKNTATLKDFYFTLESPYFGEKESKKRSRAMKGIHEYGNEALPLEIFIHILKENKAKLGDTLEKYIAFLSVNTSKKRKPSEWISIFQEQLLILGWPGFYILNSVEYQTHARWMELLSEYRQMDLVFEKITFKKALFLLKQMAGQIVFQAQKNQANIHFLGLLEASGLHFDALWIMGMNDDKFPGSTHLNPFIPQIIQREQALPHATPEVEMAFASQLLKHFMSGGDEVIFSYLSQKEDSPAFESPLIKEINKTEKRYFIEGEKCVLGSGFALEGEKSFTTTGPDVGAKNLSPILEYISDTENLPCHPDENIKGGTTLIKNQALCPFRAFAKHRLAAEDFESLNIGLNDRERGNLVHDALEKFWTTTKNQQNLLNYTDQELTILIHETAHKTVIKYVAKKPDILSEFFQELEILRLEQLLKQWLEYEKTRPNFIVDTLEQSKKIQLSELTLNIRADRVDILPALNNNNLDAKRIVIDYKTGSLPTLSDTDDRPENPQLLLYALSDPSIKSWAFAQVKPAAPLFKGKSADDLAIPGIKPIEWESERQHWEESLTALANEFLAGNHLVNPKKETTCDLCDLQGVCRVREISL